MKGYVSPTAESVLDREQNVIRLGRNTPHQKYFQASGKQVTGASTVAKIGHDNSNLMGWAAKVGPKYYQVLRAAGITGTVAHFLIQTYIEGVTPDLSEFTQDEIEGAMICYRKWREWWEEQDLTVMETELQLVSELYPYGGTVDIIARDKSGRQIIVDWKSSSGIYDDMKCQVSAYRQLVEECRGEKVFKVVIVRGGKEDSEKDFEQCWLGDELDRYFQFFQLQLALYYGKELLK